MSHSNHGSICSCLGPMIDAQIKSMLFDKEKFISGYMSLQMTSLNPSCFLGSVYDAAFLIRPSCHFRDSSVINNYTANLTQYYNQLPFNDGYLSALAHLSCTNYTTRYHGRLYISMCKEVADINERSIMLGFASVFWIIKSYVSSLTAEVSQLCYKGLFRRIALGSTHGLSTFSCTFLLSFSPLLVPVGRCTLGRILNVLGSAIDPYIELSISSEFFSHHKISLMTSVQQIKEASTSKESYPPIYPAILSLYLYATNRCACWNKMIIHTISLIRYH